MILLVDNFDSFTYNLVQYLRALGQEVRAIRPGDAELDAVLAWRPDHLVISPGPGHPSEAAFSKALMKRFIGHMPVLGVCLGHQCLAELYGGTVRAAARPVHGKTSEVRHDGRGVFAGLPDPFPAMRYHSLVVETESVPDTLEISARATTGEVMGLRVKGVTPLAEGVQFHPESILTPDGTRLLKNFLEATSASYTIR